MGDEKADIVRSAMDAWNRGDWDSAAAAGAPDLEWDNSKDAGEWGDIHTGPEQIRRMWERFVEPWESVRFDIDELIDLGDHLITRSTARFVGRDGIEVRARTAWAWTFRAGALVRIHVRGEVDEAMEAAGVRSPGEGGPP